MADYETDKENFGSREKKSLLLKANNNWQSIRKLMMSVSPEYKLIQRIKRIVR